MKCLVIALALAGCGGEDRGAGDVVGPFTGPVHRFVVDSFTFSTDNAAALQLGDDLDGDGYVDNQFGMVFATLANQDDTTEHAADMIAAGALASVVELQADELTNDGTVSATFYGADGDPATAMGGTLIDGTFRSNRTQSTAVPGEASLRLPIFRDADPTEIDLLGMELDLVPDGQGGYDGLVRGGLPASQVFVRAFPGIVQMIDADPGSHRVLTSFIDTNQDGVITLAELQQSALFRSLLVPDLRLRADDGTFAPTHDTQRGDALSAGFGIHLVACESGSCNSGAPSDRCHDRILDGDETDLDCGGSCLPCASTLGCQVPGDCQSTLCDAGVCRPASCSDGVLDGLESDVDCGGPCATRCALGQRCDFDSDCASGDCNASVLGGGTCVPPA